MIHASHVCRVAQIHWHLVETHMLFQNHSHLQIKTGNIGLISIKKVVYYYRATLGQGLWLGLADVVSIPIKLLGASCYSKEKESDTQRGELSC